MINHNVKLSAIEEQYPYKEVFGYGDESYHSDEGAEQEEEKENIKIYLEKMNAKIKLLSDAVKQAQYTISVQTNPKHIEETVKFQMENVPLRKLSKQTTLERFEQTLELQRP